jgi:putative acetyltransferase
MNPAIKIREETEADLRAITEVTVAAFKTLEISRHTEQFIVTALRAAKALTLSLVAEIDGRVVGHIAFSPVAISDGTRQWYGLGPVSVLPEHQRKGIGKALIQEGLSRLKGLGAKGCCLVGHPQYYRKFGFQNAAGLVHEGVPAEVFFALSFSGRFPQGAVAFREEFKATGEPPTRAEGEAMTFEVRRVDSFRITVEGNAAEGFKMLSLFAGAGVSLLAFKAVPLDLARTQFTLFPNDGAKMAAGAKKAGLKLDGPHSALLVQGEDEPGALADIFERLSKAKIAVLESTGIADIKSSYGVVIYLAAEDCERALAALKK